MNTSILNIRTEPDIKKEAESIYKELGMNMSTAVNIFLRQSIRCNGIPFELRLDEPSESTIEAIEEAESLLHNPKTPRYSSMKDLKAALEN
ncbi:MAG: type II toxin-antitoxin system RelB/DinJ family antitoxin [Coriobacteriia bacterium]|nr:type II toxin-antitoxin system RelB/DinJ family antitoxin [Coriobacteriia bacterium]